MNFLDPQLTSDGKPYGPTRLKEIVKERYFISKNCNTSYTDTGKISCLEKKYLLEFIRNELEYKRDLINQQNNR